MAVVNHPADGMPIAALQARALELRRHMLGMARRMGQGYIGQGLGFADVMAALYFSELRYDPKDPAWSDRDRFVMSTGHYSLALWAALAATGVIGVEELATYGADESRLDMSTLDTTPGVEVIGGSLGQGFGQAVGMALGLRLDKREARVFCEFSDGELQEGSTWEAAMAAASFGLDNLIALIDCNGIQADGRVVIEIEPVAAKMAAFGWVTQEIDGNDMMGIVEALKATRVRGGNPHAIVLRTIPGMGVASLVGRERAHFVRIDPGEWDTLAQELETGP